MNRQNRIAPIIRHQVGFGQHRAHHDSSGPPTAVPFQDRTRTDKQHVPPENSFLSRKLASGTHPSRRSRSLPDDRRRTGFASAVGHVV